MKRNFFIILIVSAVLILLSSCGFQNAEVKSENQAKIDLDNYPSKPIYFISGSSPGGVIDTYGRSIGGTLPKYLPGDGAIIVDYVLDPAGLRCPQYIWEAEPDGYKITFFFIDSIVIKELMHPEVKWTMKDFTPLGGVRQAYRVIAVSNSSSFNDINDLKSADRVIFGTLLGTAPHLSLQMFAEEFGVEASYVGYEGMNDALIGLIRGDVDAANLEMANIRPYVDSGDVRVLAYLTTDSDPAHADLDIPTADEVGLTFLSPLSSEPCAYFGPPGMDQELAKLFTKALRESLEDEYLRMWSDKTGYSLKWMEPELITEHIEKVYDLYRQNVDYLK